MEKLKLHSPDITSENIEQIAELFPNCVTETQDTDGKLKRAIDFDLLRQELSGDLVEGPQERYRLDWPGKRDALVTANTPIEKTLRPCREESVDFETTQNLYVEGDNLEALKLLQETYLNKVKMIYIDPPYNTGNDFIYDDNYSMTRGEYEEESGEKDEEGNRNFDAQKWQQNSSMSGRFHSEWLSMMYPRLKLARSLLREDGIVFISIDDGEITNLRRICDEIFGPEQFLEEIIWKNKYNAGALTKGFSNVHEYILAYSKGPLQNIAAPLSEDQKKDYSKRDEKHSVRGGYLTQPLATASKDPRPNLVFPILHNGEEIWPDKQWIWSKDRVEKAYENNEVVINKKGEKISVRVKQYLRDEDGRERLTKPLSIFVGPFNQEGTKDISSLIGRGVFGFPKPVALSARLFSCVINDNEDKDGIYLDFFSGSATTAHAVMALNAEDGGKRRHIQVQLPEPCEEKSEAFKASYATIAEIGKERIRRAAAKIRADLQAKIDKTKQGTPEHQTLLDRLANLDTGFRVLKIDSSNMADVYYRPDEVSQEGLAIQVENIKSDRTPEDLLFQVLLDWGVDLTLGIKTETIADKTVYFVDGNALAACFDTGVDEDFVKELAKRAPLRAVFRDASFASDAVRINVEQIFHALSPHTELKTL